MTVDVGRDGIPEGITPDQNGPRQTETGSGLACSGPAPDRKGKATGEGQTRKERDCKGITIL
ncbi:hypothetical protein I7I51_03921 [Histoplasma capsulatum]|uniref:Uncharacterized protein n=1 Tax=Ajellomyces capsulatus TaxID=5037 RepID=A0A8A1MAV6_AJECA|nr:hypothetical protein I7I51_03921 [Histoplasma capsulatum]